MRSSKTPSRDAATPQDGDLLLDDYQLLHLTHAVCVNLNNVELGQPSLLHIDLRAEVIDPLAARMDRYLLAGHAWNQQPLQAARELYDYVEKLADLIEARHPFGPGCGAMYEIGLTRLWGEFQRQALIDQKGESEHLHGQRKATQTARMAKIASAPRKEWKSTAGEALTPELIAARIKSAGQVPKKFAPSLVHEFGCSLQTANRLIKAARKAS